MSYSSYSICGKCGKKKMYYRAAFGSFKCYNCGLEIQTKPIPVEVTDANNWWIGLSSEQRIEIHKKNK